MIYNVLLIFLCQNLVQKAIDNSMNVRRDWERKSLDERADIFNKAAELMSGKYRMDLLASTMMGQVWTFVIKLDPVSPN